MTDLRLCGLNHLVELLPVQRQMSSGLILPDNWWSPENYNTALLLQSGPGLELDNGEHLPPVAQPGDLVIFESCCKRGAPKRVCCDCSGRGSCR